MPTYIEYQLDEKTTILVESAQKPGGLVQASAGDGAEIKKAKMTLREALQDVKAQAKLLLDEFDSLPVSEMEFKFGVSTTGELGNLVVGKVAAGVNYETTLKWKRKEEKENGSLPRT